MKYIQTLYIDNSKDPFKDSFGWAAPEYHLMGWALSCLQLHALYGNVCLYANSPAAHLLIDTLRLPYTEVNTELDKFTLIHPQLWALPKIYTYSLQQQPFLHIDGDVFLFEPLPPVLLKGELIAQNEEVATDKYYKPTQLELMRHFSFFPPCVKKDFESGISIKAHNAGLIGGSHIPFFREYTDWAFAYIQKNEKHLNHIQVNMFNVFFEQHLFSALAKEKAIPVSALFDGIIHDNGYRNLGDFHDVPFNRSYLHLLGEFKKDEYTCIQMSAKLREIYPDYYDRIVALFHSKNFRLSPSGFINDANPTKKQPDEQGNSHLRRLQFISEYGLPEIDKELFRGDFDLFYKQLTSFLNTNNDTEYFHKRDSLFLCLYRDLCINIPDVLNQTIVRCPETKTIESVFDWAGLFNKHYRRIEYYSNLQAAKGRFFNLLVPEATDNGFSLYDISELDATILQQLSEPISIHELLLRMQPCFDEDVLENHYEAFQNLILTSVKELVIKKAIMPFPSCLSNAYSE